MARRQRIALLTVLTALSSSSPLADAGKEAVVFYLDSEYRPTAKLERLGEMSKGEQAILAMYALQKGGGCEGRDEKGLKCALTEALELGPQCSEKHLQLVASWFKKKIPPMSGHGEQAMQHAIKSGDLESVCYNTPFTARHQEIWEIIRFKREKDLVSIDAVSFWMAGPDGPFGREKYSSTYRVGENEVVIVSHRKIK